MGAKDLYRKVQRGSLYSTRILNVLAVTLVLVWFAKHHKFSWNQGDPDVFSWHPLFMIIAFVVCYSEASTLYHWAPVTRPLAKLLHGGLHFCAIIFAIVGLVAVFRFHNESDPPKPNMYSLHSWIGLSTMILYCAQWLVGFVSFLQHQLSARFRAKLLPFHAIIGAPFLTTMIAATCSMGILEKLTFLGVCTGDDGVASPQCSLGNLLGLVIILWSMSVGILVLSPHRSLAGYSRRSSEEEEEEEGAIAGSGGGGEPSHERQSDEYEVNRAILQEA